MSIKLRHNELYLICSADLEEQFKEYFLIEMLQGKRWEENDQVHYLLQLQEEKAAIVKQWLRDGFPQTGIN